MRPVAQRFGEWGSASSTFSAIPDLLAVVQCEIDILFAFISKSMHAPPLPACLLRLFLTSATFSPSRHHYQSDVEMARLVALRYGRESASVPGCLCNSTGTLYHLFSVT